MASVRLLVDEDISQNLLKYLTKYTKRLVLDEIINGSPIYTIDYGVYQFNFDNIEFTVKYQPESDYMATSNSLEMASSLYLETSDDNGIKSISHFIRFLEKETISSLETNLYCFINEGVHWKKVTSLRKRSLDSVFTPHKKDILKKIDIFLKSRDDYEKLGLPYKVNFLLHGPPGTGKTTMINALANHLNYNIYFINLSGNMYDSLLIKLLSRLPDNCLLVIEDIENLFGDSNGTSLNISVLLNLLDGLLSKTNLISIMTTNYYDKLEKVFLRPGRIDHVFKFDYSNKKEISELVKYYFKDEREEEINGLMKKINSYIQGEKISMAALQKFLFEYRKNINHIHNNFDKLTHLIEQYHKSLHHLYT